MTITKRAIFALVTDAFGAYGGIAQYNQDFLTACASCSDVSTVEIHPRLITEPIENLPHGVRMRAPAQGRLKYSLKTLISSISHKPGIVFNGHVYHGPLSYMIAKITGAKLISQLHGTEVWQQLSAAQLMALDNSDLVLCVSRDTQKRYRHQSKREKDNTIVIPNTVGEAFSYGDRKRARSKFEVSGMLALLTVARLDPKAGGYKGHDRVIRALPYLENSQKELVYLIAGVGDDRSRLEQLAAELGVKSRVRFLGKVPSDELPDLYRASDLFVLPSTGEGFGIVFLEAMASGTPSLGLNIGGSWDALEGLGDAVSIDNFQQGLELAIEKAAKFSSYMRDDLSLKTTRKFGKAAFRKRVHDALKLVLK